MAIRSVLGGRNSGCQTLEGPALYLLVRKLRFSEDNSIIEGCAISTYPEQGWSPKPKPNRERTLGVSGCRTADEHGFKSSWVGLCLKEKSRRKVDRRGGPPPMSRVPFEMPAFPQKRGGDSQGFGRPVFSASGSC